MQYLLFFLFFFSFAHTESARLQLFGDYMKKQTVLTVLSEVNATGNLSQNSISFELCTKIFCFQNKFLVEVSQIELRTCK